MSVEKDFGNFMEKRLQQLKVNDAIVKSYASGIVLSDESDAEKIEGLNAIFDEFLKNANEISCELVAKFNELKNTEPNPKPTENVETRLTNLLGKQRKLETIDLPAKRDEDEYQELKALKASIISQLTISNTNVDGMGNDENGDRDDGSGDDDDDDDGDQQKRSNKKGRGLNTKSTGVSTSVGGGIERNCNAENIRKAEQEQKLMLKTLSQQKKQKDKEDREKQLRLREEKKEKRKTQKGERRR